jgi:hypothetical protein
MRWDLRHDQGKTGKDRGRWVGDAVPAQRTAVKPDPFVQVCAVLRGELIYLRALVGRSSNLTIALFIMW